MTAPLPTGTPRLQLTKHHGLGNDFLVLFEPDVADLPALARQLCDRRRGIGADGLLIATIPASSESSDIDATMVLYNADGSRAEMSGNGIRCFAQAVSMRNGGDLSDLTIQTDAGIRHVSLQSTDDPSTLQATVEMGAVQRIEEPTNWGDLGCHPDRPVAHLSLGNPHSVVGVDDMTIVDLVALGAKVPQVNLEIVEPTEHPHELRMRVHERGVGVTEACGTGATATAVAAVAWGLVSPLDGTVVVHMDGGSVSIEIDQPTDGHARLTGPTTFIASVEVPLPATAPVGARESAASR